MIIIPIDETVNTALILNRREFRKYLDSLIECYPEIFPPTIKYGYDFRGWAKTSKKVVVKRRCIQLKGEAKVYILHPCFVMPYLLGNTIFVSKGLALRKYNTPYHAIANALGENAMFWYRAELSLSTNNIVGTTIKRKICLPQHIIVDEHHNKLFGKKVYVATTVANHCILGAAVSSSVSYEDLSVLWNI